MTSLPRQYITTHCKHPVWTTDPKYCCVNSKIVGWFNVNNNEVFTVHTNGSSNVNNCTPVRVCDNILYVLPYPTVGHYHRCTCIHKIMHTQVRTHNTRPNICVYIHTYVHACTCTCICTYKWSTQMHAHACSHVPRLAPWRLPGSSTAWTQ